MKIKLTQEQIDEIIKFESHKLLLQKEEEINKIEKEYNIKLSQLKEKYIYFEIPVNEDSEINESKPNKKPRFNEEDFRRLLAETKSVKKVAEELGRSEQSIRSKMTILGIKISDYK
jgi:hypothetical protein